MDGILVVKLGGSCASSPDFNRWLHAIERASRPVVLVPGGGPFANVVRRYQPRLGYDDEAAHHMAILAMEQFGRALVSLGERLVPAASRREIETAIEAGNIPVWMPAATALAAPEIAQDWTVTSDSLAAWLAASMPGASLLLIKQIDVPKDATLEALAGAEIVDASFLAMLHPTMALSIAGPADVVLAGHQFADGVTPGHPFTAERRMAVAAE